ncbi:hypothetical protein EMIHUDRAFT_199291 [Emiliania huxleyi CCMP1516]|uniref:Uncharacterized protein n=2 Tax=Emiliania huxleyi TaxID=2903 RepID=A0A0D3I2L3_EMIH1|nr:hypothetical protein EMIHUDRAFT_199291 [Emiliania huxleyi CCMP1516]EOD05498.1 hypothetical protein EMIHUDRAFT_199291 [Emiliania huxleyi CCMP1516]|eukprot:XP_005757927.1 hypothetical protein EMIHUDRAFT_199291 [Emiliania huxleyi CCMP1516]
MLVCEVVHLDPEKDLEAKGFDSVAASASAGGLRAPEFVLHRTERVVPRYVLAVAQCGRGEPAELRPALGWGRARPPGELLALLRGLASRSGGVVALRDCAEARASCSSFLSGPPIEVVLKLACVPLALPLALALLLLWRVLPAAARLAGSVLFAASRAVHAGWVSAVEWVATHCKRCVYALALGVHASHAVCVGARGACRGAVALDALVTEAVWLPLEACARLASHLLGGCAAATQRAFASAGDALLRLVAACCRLLGHAISAFCSALSMIFDAAAPLVSAFVSAVSFRMRHVAAALSPAKRPCRT